jgi:hypothetical protein
MKETVYLESTVPSYLAARPSRDVLVLAHQQVTQEWWHTRLELYEVFVSELVLQEMSSGDSVAAKKRIESVSRFPIIPITEEAESLAQIYLEKIPALEKALRDALHLAIASASKMDYVLTWNCAHIASGEVKRALGQVNRGEGIPTPTICTPEELLGGE